MMALPTGLARLEYRVVLIEAHTRKVFGIRAECTLRLPRVHILPGSRSASQLSRNIKAFCGVRVVLLGEFSSRGADSSCVVAESISTEEPVGLQSADLNQVTQADLSAEERSQILRILRDEHESPFFRLGWINDAIRWVETSTRQRITSKSDLEQTAAGEDFSLLKLVLQNGKICWIKATSDKHVHEGSISQLLSKLCVDQVPHVVAMKPDWNAWIMLSDGDERALSSMTSPYAIDQLERAVVAMAEMQIRTMGRTKDLLRAGAFDQRLAFLRGNAADLFTKIGEAMRLQTSIAVLPLSDGRLRELQIIFKESCDLLEDGSSLPPTIIHGDLNAGNIVYGETSCRFIDWCEAYVGFPLTSLEHLLLLNEAETPERKVISDRRLIESYRSVLLKACNENSFDRALPFMPLIAAASTMLGRGLWIQTPLSDHPHRQVQIRTLARCMDRAARDVRLLKALAV